VGSRFAAWKRAFRSGARQDYLSRSGPLDLQYDKDRFARLMKGKEQ
jgi:hypothetical protein